MIAGGGNNGRPSAIYLLALGLVFHLVYIGSVFDCYFRSPVVHGMNAFSVGGSPEAKRVVLIIGDGLRADLLLNMKPFPAIPGSPEIIAPYLRSIAETRGAFGVSHTRVPTESRPGHVAIIGGMYEDVSAVTKGWKTNPVEFDSVFNRSSSTYSFGSPDILPMFARGSTPGKVKTWTYHEDEEDFTKDATALDIWVVDRLKELLHNASSNAALDAEMRSDKVVLFLHLLGLDTTGHSYRPHSKEYMRNIMVVDDIVKETEDLLESFFGDNKTAYIFTADHGMSNIGNHGDGHPDNTRTPLIAWGAGIRSTLPDSVPTSHDDYSSPWGAPLNALYRHDVNQADIAVLMAALIDSEWPVHSVGVLPDVDPGKQGWLKYEEGEAGQAKAALVNAKVILEQYRYKNALKKSHALFYKPYTGFNDASEIDSPGAKQLQEMERLVVEEQWADVRKNAGALIDTALGGLRYLQTYDWVLVRCIVTTGYLGWMVMSALFVIRLNGYGDVHSLRSFVPTAVALSLLAVSWTAFAVQRSPWTYYLYVAFPLYFWRTAALDLPVVIQVRKALSSGSSNFSTVLTLFSKSAFVISAVAAMVTGYTNRTIWTIGLICMGLVWPFYTTNATFRVQNVTLLLSWLAACLISSTFTVLPVEKNEDVNILVYTGGLYVLAGVGAMLILLYNPAPRTSQKTPGAFSSTLIVCFEIILICMSVFSTSGSIRSLQSRQGLPLTYQLIGWLSLLLSSAVPFVLPCADQRPSSRLLVYFFAFCPAFIILSVSWEGIFYLAFSTVLYLWIEMEAQVFSLAIASKSPAMDKTGMRLLRGDDVRISLFFLFFVNYAFFGTGSVASLSNFYLEPVYRLVPVFNPFLMAVLLLYKVFIPYTILAAGLATLNVRLNLPPFSLFLIALSLTDGMTLAMFYNVTDHGSWLEIGQTISHFVITSLLLVWSAGICVAGEWLMSGTRGHVGFTDRIAKDPLVKLE